MARIQELGGAATGIGGTVALRQIADTPDGSRYRQPSVLYGLGTGLLASGMYFADQFGFVNTPMVDSSLFATHAMTATPSGMFSAAFPKRSDQSTPEQVLSEVRSRLGMADLVQRDRNNSGSSGTEGTVGQERLRLNRVGTPSGRSRRR